MEVFFLSILFPILAFQEPKGVPSLLLLIKQNLFHKNYNNNNFYCYCLKLQQCKVLPCISIFFLLLVSFV